MEVVEHVSDESAMDGETYFSRLPQEILCLIVKRLSECDKVALQFAYPDLYNEQR